jgi:LysM repeat protein
MERTISIKVSWRDYLIIKDIFFICSTRIFITLFRSDKFCLTLLLVPLFISYGLAQGDFNVKKNYIEQFKWIALREMELTGIPASIKLAQGLLESNAGLSTLATVANNHFGMKCHNDWTGLTYYKVDDDKDAKGNLIPSCFRKFSSPEESYHAHSLWLTKRPRYSNLFTLEPNDYKGWAHGLKKAGYATDPSYGEKLISIIEKFDLHKIQPVPKPVEFSLEVKSETNVNKKELILQKESVKTAAVIDKSQSGVWIMNEVRFVYAKQGMSLSEISKLYDIPIKKIPKYNPALTTKGMDKIPSNQRIFLEPKRKKFHGIQKWHVVQASESLQSIADYYAIQLEPLRKRNRFFEQEEPTIGTKLKLSGKKLKLNR